MGLFSRLLPARFRAAPAPRVEPGEGRRDAAADMAARLRGNSAYVHGAARQDASTSSWTAMPLTPDVLLSQLRTIVARTREQAYNSDYAKAFLRLVKQNVLGESGIVFQPRVMRNNQLDTAANAALEAGWSLFCRRENCDITGQFSLNELAEQALISAARDGEFFVQIIQGPDAGPYGFSLQLIDAQRCPPDYRVDTLPHGGFIRGGIEFSKYGKPLAYYFSPLSTGGDSYAPGISGSGLERVPADQILHRFVAEMIGQRRGLPWYASGVYRLRHLTKFEEASITNARIAASQLGFVEYAPGTGPDEDDEPLSISTESGTVYELPEGATYREAQHAYPTGEYATFTKAQLRGFFAGAGAPYNTASGDLEGVNYSSIRQGELDSRENWKLLQKWLIEGLHARVYEAWLRYALLARKLDLPAGRLEEYKQVRWQARRWSWIDPQSEVEAAVTAKNNLFVAPSTLIREQGRDPDLVYQEIARDIAAMRAAGIDEPFIQLAMGQKLSVNKPPPQ